ncbi:MAG: hypothetical protein ACRETA_13345, partial [Gammaproteobacteria bacterium]
DLTRIMREQNGVPVVRKKDPRRHQKTLRLAARANGPCQKSEFGFTQKAMSMQQSASYKEKSIGENHSPQTRHRDAL